MKPETAAFVAKSRELLQRAHTLLTQNFADDAGRAAYLAGFHAEQARLFEQFGRSPKTHSGLQTQFAKLARSEPAIDLELRAFLGRTCNLKATADHETDPGSNVTHAPATEAIDTAGRFVAVTIGLIDADQRDAAR
jgi:uncharacterized protein (UPF0332 family)